MADRTMRRISGRSGVLIALLALTGAGCTPMDDVIVSIFGRSMRDQPSISPYENPLPPAEGSIPFASGNFPAAIGEFGMGQAEGTALPEAVTPIMMLQALGAPEDFPPITGLVNPANADAASLARGETLFLRTCAPCHGPSGEGDGAVVAAGMPSWSVVSDEASGYSDGYLYSIIRVGRGAMPGYAHQLAHYDRWHIVNYLRSLQGQGSGAATASDGDGESPDA